MKEILKLVLSPKSCNSSQKDELRKANFKLAVEQQNLALNHILRNLHCKETLSSRFEAEHQRKTSMARKPPLLTSTVDCLSLGRNPLMKETSMAKLQRWKLEQYLKFYKYKACPWNYYVGFVH